MNRMTTLLPAIVLAGTAATAQEYTYRSPEPAYTFKTVLHPGTIIAGHPFGPKDSIGSAIINDAGEVAFVVHWLEYPKDRTAIFTLHRMVAKEGDTTDFADIAFISLNAHIAINAQGTVAYEAMQVQVDAPSVFIERTVALSTFSPNPSLLDFSLGEKGELVIQDKPSCAKVNAETTCSPFAMLASNHSGQVVVPINTMQGPFLLVGTPAKH